MDQESTTNETPAAKWQPLNSRQRRVLGVLIEKAKATPDAYPMTLNGLTTGCNQKSNRDPQMNLSTDEVEEVLEQLREMGAVAEVQAGGRVAKYRHYAYEWLGVDKTEVAVMAELLLRGEQTVGELRGRAARMEPIADLNALRPVLQSLIEKKLVLSLTPEGRGQIVSHNLYKPRELEELMARLATSAGSEAAASPGPPAGHTPAAPATLHSAATPATPGPPAQGGVTRDMFAELEVEVAELRAEMARVRQQLRELEDRLS